MTTLLTPAAEYLRMSTDQQEFSITNQQDQIRKYAIKHGLEIVRTYADPGRSGLTLRERKGLSQLLADVLGGTAPFNAICVYDVSRWGRFQDSDESAHYEFICKKAGVPIHYCAEQFTNDGTMPSAMFKALKRTMAAEYSRELSSRMSAAKRRFASLGYRQGGEAGYGFRRLAVSADGVPRRLLEPGERKPFVTDRIKLVHGPAKEVAVVRRIFRMFIEAGGSMGPTQIAIQLNREKISFVNDKPWLDQSVRHLLRNPKYTGLNVWGRTTTTLHTRVKNTAKQQWVSAPLAFKPIIDIATFKKAERLLRFRAEQKVRPIQLLRELKRLLKERGRLCVHFLGNENGTYSECTFRRAFGTMKKALGRSGSGMKS
jgi:DNA invertase Pin-like site-specific DNA recombinase